MKKYILCYSLCIFFLQVSKAVPIYKGSPAVISSFFIGRDKLPTNEYPSTDSVSLNTDKNLSVKKDTKISFLNKIFYKRSLKKLKRQLSEPDVELSPADKKAKTSMILGVLALLLAIIPFIYTIVLAIPLGIFVIVMGKKAKKMGTKKKTGIGFAIAALIIVALWGLLLAAYVGFV